MMTKPSATPGTKPYSEEHHAFLRDWMRTYPEVREGRMFGHPAFFVGKKMFACVYGDGVGLKLPAERAAALLAAPDVVPFQPYGKPRMREWVQINRAVSEDYLGDRDAFEQAIRYVAEDGGDCR